MSKEYNELLCTAAWEGALSDVQNLLRDPNLTPVDLNKPNKRGQTALYCAARQRQIDIVIELLNWDKNGGINVDQQIDPHRGTALHAASFNEDCVIVALLLFKGANPHILNKQGLSARQEAKGAAIDVYLSFGFSQTPCLPEVKLKTKWPELGKLKNVNFVPVTGDKKLSKLVAIPLHGSISKSFTKTASPRTARPGVMDLKFGTETNTALPPPRPDSTRAGPV